MVTEALRGRKCALLRLQTPSLMGYGRKGADVEPSKGEHKMKEISLTCNVRRIHKQLVKNVQARFSESDRSFEEWMALRLLFEGRVKTAGDLAREFGIATGATTRLIDNLEEQGFIERDKKSGDRRVVLVRLTDKGAQHFEERLPDLLECWNEVLGDWSPDEVEQLTLLMAKLESSFARTASK